MITQDTSGLLPLPDDYEGHVLVLHPDKLGARWQLPKFQLIECRGGFGCKPDKIGSKVFGTFLADGEDTQYRRGDFIGEASETMIADALADTRQAAPIDPTQRAFLVIGKNLSWGRADTLEAAKKNCRVNGMPIYGFHCHPETYLTDFGMLAWPKGCERPVEVWKRKGVK